MDESKSTSRWHLPHGNDEKTPEPDWKRFPLKYGKKYAHSPAPYDDRAR